MAERSTTSRLPRAEAPKKARRLPKVDLEALEIDAGEAPPPPRRRRHSPAWGVGVLLGSLALLAGAVVNAHPWPAAEEARASRAGVNPAPTKEAARVTAEDRDPRDVRDVQTLPPLDLTLRTRGFDLPLTLEDGRTLQVVRETRGYTVVTLMPGPHDPPWRDPQQVLTAEPGDTITVVAGDERRELRPQVGRSLVVRSEAGGFTLGK